MITINLKNEAEAQILVNLINIANQTKGLEAAEASVYFFKLISKAVDDSKVATEKELPKETEVAEVV